MGINTKKRVISFLLLVVMLMGICQVIYADDVLSIAYDSQAHIIEVKGSLEYGKNNRLLSVTVAPKEGGEFVHIAQTTVNYDGAYSCSFPFDGELGDYTIAVHCEEIYEEADFSYGSDEQILEKINKAETADELLSYVEKFRINLDFESPTYKNRLSDEQKQQVLDSLCDIEFKQLSQINENFEKLAFDIALNNAGIWQNVEAILRENKDLLDLDFTDFDELSEPGNVLKLFLDGVTSEDAKKVFDDAVSEELENQNKDNSSSRPSYGGGSSVGKPSGSIYVNKTEDTPKKFETSFMDLEEVSWAKEAITYLEEKGIVSGTEKGKFDPMAPVSRAQFVKMLSVAFGFYSENSSCSFADVPNGSWFYAYVASAAAKGIIFGRDDGTFGPDDSITRQDMSVIAYRCAQIKNVGVTAVEFKDKAEIAPYALDAVTTLGSAGILSGTGNGEFNPNATSTRAQAAKVIFELIKHMNK